MSHLETSIDIDATAARVWSILGDFPGYGQWNPFIVAIEGRLRAGATLTLKLCVPGTAALTVRPRLTLVTPARDWRWTAHALAPGLLEGEHALSLKPRGDAGCRLIQTVQFSGELAPLFLPTLTDAARTGFDAMNSALKSRAERT